MVTPVRNEDGELVYRIAHIEGGKVVNISLSAKPAPEGSKTLVDATGASIGDSYQDGKFVKPTL